MSASSFAIVSVVFACGVVGDPACHARGCEGEEDVSLLQAQVSKHAFSKDWCAAPAPSSSDTKAAALFESLLSAAAAALQANEGVVPAYLHVTLGSEAFMCSAAHAVYNSFYPPLANPITGGVLPSGSLPSPPDYFAQKDRDSCSISATAFSMALAKPQAMIQYLADLYFKGEITSVSIKPRAYVLEMNPAEDKDCDRSSGCQTGPIFVWTTALRDARNQVIMAELAKQGIEIPVNATMITTTPVFSPDSQGGNGASYFAVPDDVSFWCKLFEGADCTWIQGACKDDACMSFLNNLLPAQLTQLQDWYLTAAAALAEGKAPPPYTGPYENVKSITIREDLVTVLGEFYMPVSASQLVANAPAMLCINDLNLRTGFCNESVDGQALSMCPGVGEPTSPTCTPGQAPCVCNHWVVMPTCAAGICDVWSWGALYKIKADNLAAQTTTIFRT